MEARVVGAGTSDEEGADEAPSSYSDVFWDVCGFYMSAGMPWELYWEGDAKAVVPFRRKRELESERDNFNAWLQGLYVYEAVGDLAPILHAFAKKGTKASPYRSEPMPVTEKQAELAKERKVRREREETLARMHAWAEGVNARMKKRKDG